MGSRLFSTLRVPAVLELWGVIARTYAGLAQSRRSPAARPQAAMWEEIAIELEYGRSHSGNGVSNNSSSPAADARRTRVIRMIEDLPAAEHSLEALAREVRLSRCHFLRIVQQLTSLTPHQYVRWARLRRAAARLLLEPTRILELALDSGFGDISNFNRAFQSEFGVSATMFRRACSTKETQFRCDVGGDAGHDRRASVFRVRFRAADPR